MSNSWKVAPALVQLLLQINQKWPGRSKAWDGTVGDLSHQERKSDHNPDFDGVVRALDVTHDPLHGLSSEYLAEGLRLSRDKRIRCIISNRKIAEAKHGFEWAPYHGASPHDHHCHVSVQWAPERDDASMWDLSKVRSTTSSDTAAYVPPPIKLQLGSHNSSVMELQGLLQLPADSIFGKGTKAAVQEFQKAHGLLSDGIVGPATWALLKGIKK